MDSSGGLSSGRQPSSAPGDVVGGDLAAAGEVAGAFQLPDGVAVQGRAVADLLDVEEAVAAAAELGQEVGEDVLDGEPGREGPEPDAAGAEALADGADAFAAL